MLSWCCGKVENVVIYVSVLTFRRSPIKAHFSTWIKIRLPTSFAVKYVVLQFCSGITV